MDKRYRYGLGRLSFRFFQAGILLRNHPYVSLALSGFSLGHIDFLGCRFDSVRIFRKGFRRRPGRLFPLADIASGLGGIHIC